MRRRTFLARCSQIALGAVAAVYCPALGSSEPSLRDRIKKFHEARMKSLYERLEEMAWGEPKNTPFGIEYWLCDSSESNASFSDC